MDNDNDICLYRVQEIVLDNELRNPHKLNLHKYPLNKKI